MNGKTLKMSFEASAELKMWHFSCLVLVKDCEGYDCVCSPQREECCHNCGKDGKGHLTININELCSIEELVKDPSKFTNEEIQMLAEALAKLGE